MKQLYMDVLDQLNLFNTLAPYEPTVIGTPPLNIDIDTSDIDIACTAPTLPEFVSAVTVAYSDLDNFSSEYFQIRDEPAARCVFNFGGWEIELFCQTIPIEEQWGVRHFKIEKNLLQMNPKLSEQVIKLKRSGLNTEEAFASILGLAGDPFEAVLTLESLGQSELADLILQ